MAYSPIQFEGTHTTLHDIRDRIGSPATRYAGQRRCADDAAEAIRERSCLRSRRGSLELLGPRHGLWGNPPVTGAPIGVHHDCGQSRCFSEMECSG